jgi:hypothetical protein
MPLEERLDVLDEDTEEFARILQGRNAVWTREQSLEAFYSIRCVPCDRRIIMYPSGRMTKGGLLQSGRDTDTRARKLMEYQEEMRVFTDFLKQQFFASRF